MPCFRISPFSRTCCSASRIWPLAKRGWRRVGRWRASGSSGRRTIFRIRSRAGSSSGWGRAGRTIFRLALAGGERRGGARPRAIAPRPGALLRDEPFSNLDRRMRDAIRDETVAILRETGATTIVVTHDPEEAMRIADRIVLMRSGAIIQQGEAEEIYLRPANLF